MGSSLSHNWISKTMHLVSMWLIPVMMSMEEVTSLGMCHSVYFELTSTLSIRSDKITGLMTKEDVCHDKCLDKTEELVWMKGREHDTCHRHGPLCSQLVPEIIGDLAYPSDQYTHSDMYYQQGTAASYGLGFNPATSSSSFLGSLWPGSGYKQTAQVGAYKVSKFFTCKCTMRAHYPKISLGPLSAIHLPPQGGIYQSAACDPQAVAERHVLGSWQLSSFGPSLGPSEVVEFECDEDLTSDDGFKYEDAEYCRIHGYEPLNTESFETFGTAFLPIQGQIEDP
ncbi:hypothetical protein BCR37DRAFT_218977 [Protomyces lactucae-debilis]|uniref:Uncharacterized protein n=1 Tax=Protomyces lactucae-debilis TaxID=2754530 RepID=A0A1Y2FQV1_PROLT|nr:uncharacterized protein BCR37DRAFT_218977 [Protomyces lactucae-debilis]ORY86382.1 hypothetical protein BCR37DRAFT_218977 [Protomyces lactucae-debilis]